MPDYRADHVSKIRGPGKIGWFQLSLLPLGLDAPAMVVVTDARRETLEPIARIVVGPSHPVSRAVYLPVAEFDLELHVFARRGEVRGEVERIDRAGLARGIWARLSDMRHLSLSGIGARGLGVLRRMHGRTQPVGMLAIDPIGSIEGWLAKYGRVSEDTIATLQAASQRRGPTNRIVLLDARGAGVSAVARSMSAIGRQIGVPQDLVTLNDKAELSSDDATKLTSCTTLFWIEAGEEPVERALLVLDAAIRAEGGIAFADWIEVGPDGACQPVFSAGWDAVRAAAGFERRGAIALRGKALSELVSVLTGNQLGSMPVRGATINALAERLREDGMTNIPSPLTKVRSTPSPIASPRPCAQPALRPLVSLIVPTHARAELLGRCVVSCFDRTTYRPLELVVVDHASRGTEMIEVLAAIRQRPGAIVVREEGPFNFSHLINVGVGRSTGEIIVLLNDDVEAISGEWLATLVASLEQHRIGIVGPRLLYPDGRIQHNGVALGMGGLAGHPGRGSRPDQPDPNRADPWPRTVSAVTGACLVMRRSDFAAVGGMDEKLAVEFNDVDLCLRVGAHGLRCVVDPRISLVHHEQATRVGGSVAATLGQSSDRDYFVTRWGHVLADDPWFSPNLTLADDSCGLADPPRSLPNLAPRRRELIPQPRS